MTQSPGRFPWTAAISAVLLLALFEYLFFVPLRPTAWGGPRGEGPYEEGSLPAAGRWARDARLGVEKIATWRSPARPLEATAEALAGYHALLAVLRYGLLWVILRRIGRCGVLVTIAVVAAALPMLFGAPRQTEADVGLLLFVVLLAATTLKRTPWWLALAGLPALFAFWANAHASAVVGLAWLSVITLGRVIEWWNLRDQDECDRPTVLRLYVTIALCVAATCANPGGPQLFVDAFAATKNPNLGSLPGWQPVDFSKPAGMPWAHLATLAALLLVQLASSKPFAPTVMIVLLSFGFWPLVQQRGSEYWWLIVPWLLVPQVATVLGFCSPLSAAERGVRGERSADEASPNPAPQPPPRSGEGEQIRSRRGWLLPLIVLLALLATPAARWFITGSPRSLEAIDSRDTPARVAQELTADDDNAGQFVPDLREQIRATYPNQRFRGAILCGEEQGDFLAWVLDGDNNQPVIMYTRPETLPEPHWSECRRALDGESPWWEILGRQQVNLVAIDPGRWPKLADRLRTAAEWRTVQDDGPGGLLVSVRREPKLPIEMLGPWAK